MKNPFSNLSDKEKMLLQGLLKEDETRWKPSRWKQYLFVGLLVFGIVGYIYYQYLY